MIETEKPKVTISKPKGDGIVRYDKQIWFNSNKNISITIYDKDSGISNADIEVNGIDVTADKTARSFLKYPQRKQLRKETTKNISILLIPIILPKSQANR